MDLAGVGPPPPARERPGVRVEEEGERKPRPPERGWEAVDDVDEEAPRGARGVEVRV